MPQHKCSCIISPLALDPAKVPNSLLQLRAVGISFNYLAHAPRDGAQSQDLPVKTPSQILWTFWVPAVALTRRGTCWMPPIALTRGGTCVERYGILLVRWPILVFTL